MTAEEVQLELVETVKFALVAPAPTVTLPGTVATEVLLLESAIAAPPAGAAALSVTVPVDALPAGTLVGLRLTEERVPGGGVTVSTADLVTPLKDAEIVTAVEAVTGSVPTVKVLLKAPAGTITQTGTVATQGLLLESVTTAPPAGAAPFRVTVPYEGVHPGTLAGFRLSEATAVGGGVTVSTADLVTSA